MDLIKCIRVGLDRVLAMIVMILVLVISVVVILGFSSRLIGMPFSWTGEVAGIGLAWLTFYGSALAACRGAHIGSPSIQAVVPPAWRVVVALAAEIITIGFLVLLAWTGMQVVQILEGSRLVSLPAISQQLTQSTVPIGAALFILAELLRLPETLDEARRGGADPVEEAEDDLI